MALLITFVLIALVFSFLCSIAEAVLLSVTAPYVALLEKQQKPSGALLRQLKSNINKPLAAILTLNTIAHTIGAAGAGAQVTVVFGSAYLGVASAILTLLILFLSEIIPKTLGAHHWRALAPATAYGLKFLVASLYPIVMLVEKMTRGLAEGQTVSGFDREEFAVMAELSAREGQLAERESDVLRNLLLLREIRVKDAMTPRTVVFSLPRNMLVVDYFHHHEQVRFSRIPVYSDDPDHVEGFVLRGDLLLAQASGQSNESLALFMREIPILPKSLTLAEAFNHVLRVRAHIAQVVDEFGSPVGILTLEDIIETLLGLEIVDEGDEFVNMQDQARRLWRRRARDDWLDFSRLKDRE
ncbi:MAG: HlyC/CorC family transporter [Xanthomonadales bacterium]|nr:hemolysin family protein [Gammaproteobacteria bacterium]MBT8053090.1 hemolysin family protein [Gammaproteobacteria bacterium]NND56258.1 HlyC/CorC family transporter [Xanthomonadales bacterium]NNK52333.1 HlyC/CorC family transporter [Xanthomonadales bacterium]